MPVIINLSEVSLSLRQELISIRVSQVRAALLGVYKSLLLIGLLLKNLGLLVSILFGTNGSNNSSNFL